MSEVKAPTPTQGLVNLKGRVILVPGSSGGMGRDVARLLSACGATLALTYFSRREPAEEALAYAQSCGSRARVDRLDTTDRIKVKAWIDDVSREFGRIDCLASCVGAHLPEGFSPFMEQDPERWGEVLNAQLVSYFYMVHAVLPYMIKQQSGRVLTISSDGGKVGEGGAAVASAAHGGLIAFSKAMAREVGRKGITANVVCPGPTEGPTIEQLRSAGTSGAKMIEEMIRRMPMKRLCTAREVSSVVAFLCSDGASFINGQAISVSGGLVMN